MAPENNAWKIPVNRSVVNEFLMFFLRKIADKAVDPLILSLIYCIVLETILDFTI